MLHERCSSRKVNFSGLKKSYKVNIPFPPLPLPAMPLYIRQLPGTKGVLIKKESYPKNSVLLNPSATLRYIYIRCIESCESAQVNHILIYDTKESKMHTIPYDPSLLEPTLSLYRGLEDLRIIEGPDGRILFTATSIHGTKNMNSEILMGFFDKDLKKIEHLQALDFGERPIKNVCPFIWNSRVCLLDALRMKIHTVDMDHEDREDREDCSGIQFLKDITGGQGGLRGSTSPVHLYGNTWGYIVHDIIFNDNARHVTQLSYYHHWIEIDMERAAITFISAPFWISHWGIEFVSGLVRREDGSFDIYYGVNDQVPMRCTTTLSDLRVGK